MGARINLESWNSRLAAWVMGHLLNQGGEEYKMSGEEEPSKIIRVFGRDANNLRMSSARASWVKKPGWVRRTVEGDVSGREEMANCTTDAITDE